MNRTVLIDGDTLLFAASTASEYEVQWTPWLWTLHADLDEAITKFEQAYKEIVERTEPSRTVFALSDPLRFRPLVLPTYKSNRKNTRKPIVYQPLREYVLEKYETFMRPWLEGDDILGILMTHPTLIEDTDRLCVSIDKDLKTVPGFHMNYEAPGEGGFFHISEEEADRNFMSQVLTGDATDGYKGLPGCGPVKAAKILDGMTDIGEMWPAVVKAYEKGGLSEEVALQQAQVARILRADDYDYSKKEVILWTP